MYLSDEWLPVRVTGLPHSEIPGSLSTYDFPRHIAVSYVLLHLLMPRHSPYALVILSNMCKKTVYSVYFVIISLKSFPNYSEKTLIY